MNIQVKCQLNSLQMQGPMFFLLANTAGYLYQSDRKRVNADVLKQKEKMVFHSERQTQDLKY